MKKNQNWIVLLMVFILLINGVFIKALADDDDHEEKKWYKNIFDSDDDDDDHQNSSKKHIIKYITPVNNSTYEEECGACHFPYQPELLPSGSWEKIMAGLADHFGEEIEIDTESISIHNIVLIQFVIDFSHKYTMTDHEIKKLVKMMISFQNQQDPKLPIASAFKSFTH